MTTKKASKKGSAGSEKAAPQKTEEELVELLRNKAQAYLKLPNVTSVGVGYRIKDGQPTDELAIQFTVGKKLAPELLVAEGLTALPETITDDDGTEVPVDVIERSYETSFKIIEDPMTTRLEAAELTPKQTRRSRLDPVRPGISVGHVDITAGTLGGVVFDALNGTPYILSNWHVLNGPTGAIGDKIVQPGKADDGNIASNSVGNLVRSHLGVAGDCAIASIVGRAVNDSIFELDTVPRRVGKANIGDKVVKSGRTTGVTFGVVNRVGVVLNMNYGGDFNDQQIGGFEIGPNPDKLPDNGEISMGGDSGSLWMVDTNGPEKDVVLGLHFAGETDPNPAAEHAVACNIHSVFEKLQITLTNPLAGPQSAERAAGRGSRRRRS